MLELSETQQQAVDAQPGQRLEVVDPRTQQGYVLLRAELCDHVKAWIGPDRLTEDERRAATRAVWRHAGWDDPALDDCAALDPRRQP
jgi:hypothetical protein